MSWCTGQLVLSSICPPRCVANVVYCVATNNNGIAFSQAQFTVDRKLTADEYALVSKMSEQVKAFSNHIGYDVEEHPKSIDILVDEETGEVIEPLE